MGDTDWTIVTREPCPQCGRDVSSIAPAALSDALADEADLWTQVLADADQETLRKQPSPGVWCALEYAAHVRDVFGLFAERVVAMLTTDAPTLGWWDHESAAVDEGYRDQDPAEVAAGLTFNAERLIDVVRLVPVDGWDRSAVRRPGESFSVVGLVRFAVHESAHHRDDAASSMQA